jgi:hypothetical protein
MELLRRLLVWYHSRVILLVSATGLVSFRVILLVSATGLVSFSCYIISVGYWYGVIPMLYY